MTKKPDYCPEWFDIDLYERYVARFHRHDWSGNINCRIKLYQELNRAEANLIDIKRQIINLPNNLREYKFNDNIEREITQENIEYAIDNYCFYFFVYNYISLYSGSQEMREIFNIIKKEADKHLIEHKDNDDSLVEVVFESVGNLIDKHEEKITEQFEKIHQNTFNPAFVLLDWNVSDEIIIESFKRKLRQFRLKQFGKDEYPQASESKLKRLHKNQILPFMDLYLWSQCTGETFTDREIAALIYPIRENTNLDFDPVDRVSRTTKPQAVKILKGEVLFSAV